jgi:glycine dehydrogenase subunit 1
MPYIQNTDEDRREMLKAIGVDDFQQLLRAVPEELRLRKPLPLGPTLSDYEVETLFRGFAAANRLPRPAVDFLGGGAYHHFHPAVVQSLLSRAEYYTAYTPYQAEVSQGTLQTIYEFQSLLCRLTRMDVSNASLYEAGSAVMEACNLCLEVTRKRRILVAETINPRYLEVLQTYYHAADVELVMIPATSDHLELSVLEDLLDEQTAGVVVQSPNYYGSIEDDSALAAAAQEKGARYVSVYQPTALGLLRPPGEFGADVAVAEGQPLSVPLSFGGPYVGFFSARKEYVRKMPGRIIGATEDVEGRPGFVMTYQTREQHIRREKATSNICSNQALVALAATIYMSYLGEKGLVKMSSDLYSRGVYLAEALTELSGVRLFNRRTWFREFVVELPRPAREVARAMLDQGVAAGLPLDKQGLPNHLLVATHELHVREDLDNYVSKLKSVLG